MPAKEPSNFTLATLVVLALSVIVSNLVASSQNRQ